MAGKPTTPGRSAVQAALVLHTGARDPEAILALLGGLVTELGLAAAAVVRPAPAAGRAMETAEGVARLPIVHPAGGRTYGLLECRGVEDRALGDLRALVAHAAVALARMEHVAMLADREQAVRRIAERLQDSLLPEVPTIANTLVAVRYRAAGREARVGGDFYDLAPLPDGRVLVVVGDVMGKGVEAAGRTSLITHTLRALALQELPLDDLLARADEQVTFQDPELMATVWCGLYEPASGEITFASLGHPPALLVRADGEPLRLAMEGLPLGLRDLGDEPPECRTRALSPRDLLVLYTDGVVEASRDYVAGQEALVEAIVRRIDEPLERLVVEALDELLAHAGHTDDALMLLLRRREEGVRSSGELA